VWVEIVTAGTFSLTAIVDALFFIGSHLVALNWSGKLGVWHAMSQNWQVDYSACRDAYQFYCLGIMAKFSSFKLQTMFAVVVVVMFLNLFSGHILVFCRCLLSSSFFLFVLLYPLLLI